MYFLIRFKRCFLMKTSLKQNKEALILKRWEEVATFFSSWRQTWNYQKTHCVVMKCVPVLGGVRRTYHLTFYKQWVGELFDWDQRGSTGSQTNLTVNWLRVVYSGRSTQVRYKCVVGFDLWTERDLTSRAMRQ